MEPGINQSVGVAERCAIGSNPGLPKSFASVAVGGLAADETEAVAPEISAAPPPGSRRERKTTVGDDGNITRAEGVPRLTEPAFRRSARFRLAL
jgi:hypothetical protein